MVSSRLLPDKGEGPFLFYRDWWKHKGVRENVQKPIVTDVYLPWSRKISDVIFVQNIVAKQVRTFEGYARELLSYVVQKGAHVQGPGRGRGNYWVKGCTPCMEAAR